MALDFEVKTFQQILDDMVTELKNQQSSLPGKKLTDFSEGSVTMTLLRPVAAVLSKAWTFIEDLVKNFYVSTATGDPLKRRFRDFAFEMLEGTKASGQVLVIRPAGDQFRDAIRAGDILRFGTLEFRVTSGSQEFGPPGTTRVARALTVQAVANSSAANLAANTQLTAVDSRYRSLVFLVGTALDSQMMNATQGGLTGGADDETPEDARERFQDYIQSLGKGTTAAIEAAVRASSAQIRAATVYDNTRLSGAGVREAGYPGRIVVQVQPVNPLPNNTLDPEILAAVNAAVLKSKAAGVAFDVQAVSSVDVNVKVLVGANLDQVAFDALKVRLGQVLTDAFEALEIDAPLYTRALVGQLFSQAGTGIPGGISAEFTWGSGPSVGDAATDANGKIMPSVGVGGQILSLGQVTYELVSV